MTFAARCLIYVVGGGALLAAVRPPRGLWEVLAVLAWIGACTAADAFVTGPAKGNAAAPGTARQRRRLQARAGWRPGAAFRDSTRRHGLDVLFTSGNVAEAEALSAQLRERGLRPMLVTQRGGQSGEDVTVEVRLPKHEWSRALPVVSRFSSR